MKKMNVLKFKYQTNVNKKEKLRLLAEDYDKNNKNIFKQIYLIKLKLKYRTSIYANKKLRIFGKNFIKNNKNNCKMIYKNKIYNLKEYIDDIDKNYKSTDFISIKLIGINHIINAGFMFYGCYSLIAIYDMQKWNTYHVIDMSGMFYECNSLISLPDISKWNTYHVINMLGMFYKCNSLISLPENGILTMLLICQECFMNVIL